MLTESKQPPKLSKVCLELFRGTENFPKHSFNKVPAPVRGRALGDIFMLAPDGVEAKTRAKRAFCPDQELSQVPKTLEAHRNFVRKCNFPMRFLCIFKVFFSQGLQNSKFRHLFVCKIVLSPQRGRVFHCEHLGFCKGSFCTQCHLQGLAAKDFRLQIRALSTAGARFSM